MSVKNVTVADLALIDLLRAGTTDAPSAVLAMHEAKGYLTLSRGKPSLTAKGRKRALNLKGAEHYLRQMAKVSTSGRCALTTAAGGSLKT